MKAVTYYSYDDIRLENRYVPTITDYELLVKVHGCGLCGSDILKIVQQASPPVILGHELTGTIVEMGRGVTNFTVGQRVIVAHHVPCGHCHYCRHGNYSMCASFKTSNIDPCGFAEYIRVPAQHVQQTTLQLPATLNDEAGSFVEPLACCIRAVRRMPLLSGDTIVILGLGSIGLLMLQAFKALAPNSPQTTLADKNNTVGAILYSRPSGEDTSSSAIPRGRPDGENIHPHLERHSIRVYGIDLFPERLQLARELGVDDAFLAPTDEQGLRQLIASLTEDRGADAIIITAAGARPFLQAIASVRKGGTIHIFAAHAAAVPMNLAVLYQQELSIITTYSSSPKELRIALDLLNSRKVRVESLISHRLPLEQFAEGVALMQKQAALKVYFQIAGEA
ncbi:MAG: alcohol dehydrogenase catalytic domain-containing protein [Chloroflexota bacterium]|nr:alcohol dehydrogenase catalytic domain-containing protein [Chloroflexota bacterium]